MTSSFSGRLLVASLFFVSAMVVGSQSLAAPLGPLTAIASVAAASEQAAAEDTNLAPLDAQGRRLYVVQLNEPALASYAGGIAGLAATTPRVTGASRLNVDAPASRAYLAYLESRHSEVLGQASALLSRTLTPSFQYLNVLNGMAISLSPAEAARLAGLPGVRAVMPDRINEIETDVGPIHIGAPAIWQGLTVGEGDTRGEGVIIGVLDTGINSGHPAFAATDSLGYTHTNPYGADVYVGWCATNPSFCNAKLIGAWTFHPNGGSPEDTNGHGSHTASTAGGNVHEAAYVFGGETFDVETSGVAPRANVIAYKVCDPSCPSTSSVASVNQAISDGVDVLNYSISGSDNPWNDMTDLAFLDAFNAGMFVSASAGNAGPGPSTVAKTGPWNAAVGASTHQRIFANILSLVGGPQEVPAGQGTGPALAADYSGALRWAGDADAANVEGCNAFAAGAFAGQAALIRRGGCTFAIKVNNAVAAGANFVVVYNNAGGPPTSMGGLEATTVSSVMVDDQVGAALITALAGGTANLSVLAGTDIFFDPGYQDVMGGFSSRGPSQFDVLAPTYVAPGVNILAAGPASGGNANQWFQSQGTSMSSPHGAGAAALLMGLHPTWTPAQVRSALATSASAGVLRKEDGVTPANPFDQGSGLLNLDAAGRVTLAMNETGANFLAANPGTGGDPRTLNVPHLVDQTCVGGCQWTRTFTNISDDTYSYDAAASSPVGTSISVSPASFTLAAGASQALTITVTVDPNVANLGAWNFGSVSIVPAAGGSLNGALLNENFSDVTFPPTGWSVHKLAGAGTATWIRDTAQSSSAPASARRIYGGSADGNQDDWLVTPVLNFAADAYELNYAERGQWMDDYGYSGVWASTGSCNPADGEFFEIAETANIPNVAWGPRTINLAAVANQSSACLAFRYSGTFAHTWWIDDVSITEGVVILPATQHLPVAFIPSSSIPEISVTPASLSATQPPGQVTTQILNIANIGGGELNWTIDEAPTASVMLSLSGSRSLPPMNAEPDRRLSAAEPVTHGIDRLLHRFQAPSGGGGAPYELLLDDGSAENAIGVGGAQFLWLNRFTPSPVDFPVTLNQVEVMFGYPASTGGINVGELVDIYLYEDADGNPANGATHRASLLGQAVQAVDGVVWSTYALSEPVEFTGPGDILVAVVNRTAGVTPGTFPAAIDQTPPSLGRSWAGFGAVPGDPPVLPLPTFGIIDTFGAQFAGNWMVRAQGTSSGPCVSPEDVPWLNVNPTSGVTNAGATSPVEVSFDSTGLEGGSYEAVLCVNSDDPNNPLVSVPVNLEVEPGAAISVDVSQINLVLEGGAQGEAVVNIGNLGTADLEWNIETENVVLGRNYGYGPRSTARVATGHDRASGISPSGRSETPVTVQGLAPITGSWSEGFDDILLLPAAGWAQQNNSAPPGTSVWFQGNDTVFPAHEGATNSYIAANFNSTTGANTISNWLMTPEMTLSNGTEIRFWTRRTNSTWEDRLQVRLSTAGASTNVGSAATDVGDFTELLLDINPTYAPGGYPQVWTEYVLELSDLPAATTGRVAFRYFVENGGPTGANSDYLGIDSFSVTQPAPSLIYDNGSFITSTGDGPGGSDVSLLQNISLGLNTLGAAVNLSAPGPHFRMADDFSVTGFSNWQIDTIRFYGYQTGSPTTSSFTGVNFQIWDGVPGGPDSTVVFGDTDTNRFLATGWTGVYRYAENNVGTTRPIMYIDAEADVSLPPGNYWLDWQLAGSIASGPWQPPVTVLGESTTGNARQLVSTGWQPFTDTGTGTPAQGAPFQLYGFAPVPCESYSNVPWLSISPTSGTTPVGESDEVTVSVDATGLAVPSAHAAYICIESNDPVNPVWALPVWLNVVNDGIFQDRFE